MAFMIPVYEHGTFIRATNEHGESDLYPLDCADLIPADHERENETGWFCRLSAPGYMDATEWTGPFETEQDAREHIESTYDVDADTGDKLDA